MVVVAVTAAVDGSGGGGGGGNEDDVHRAGDGDKCRDRFSLHSLLSFSLCSSFSVVVAVITKIFMSRRELGETAAV